MTTSHWCWGSASQLALCFSSPSLPALSAAAADDVARMSAKSHRHLRRVVGRDGTPVEFSLRWKVTINSIAKDGMVKTIPGGTFRQYHRRLTVRGRAALGMLRLPEASGICRRFGLGRAKSQQSNKGAWIRVLGAWAVIHPHRRAKLENGN